ncbi:MAG: response regulator [Desulfobacterales bacterium]|nr:response regulator [Desulfobacterales bacterium]
MNNIEQQFIDELLFCIKENDLQKSYALLQFIPTISPEIQNRALFEISNANDGLSYSMFEYLVRVEIADDAVRNKLYEIILDKGRVNNEFYFIYIRMADENKMPETVPVLLDIITTETNIGILMETIRALSNIGHGSSVMALSEFIYYNDEMLKREAILALERIGGTTARQALEFAAKTSKASPIILSTLDKLRKAENLPPFTFEKPALVEEPEPKPDPVETKPVKDTKRTEPEKTKEIEIEIPEETQKLLDMFNSGNVELRHQAIDSLIEQGEECISAIVHNMDLEDADNLINSLDILGNISSKAAASPILKVIDNKHKDSNVRFAAFEALERLPKLKSALVLIEGVTDPSEQVRIAAAAAIDKNLSDVLLAGLRSKIDSGGRAAKLVIEGIMDSRSENTFEALLESDAFTFGSSNYLTHDAEPEVREYFIKLLKNRGNKALAGRIAFDTQKDKIKNRLTIYAVDDSRIMLNFYVKKIYKMGHSPIVFTNPNKALKMIKKSKPSLVITDLNMLETSGLQLASKIRNIYPDNLLPIVIITTQGDFIFDVNQTNDSDNKKQVTKCGVTKVLKKPLNPDELLPFLDAEKAESGLSDILYTLSSENPDIRYKNYQNVLKENDLNMKELSENIIVDDIDLSINKLNILSEKGDESSIDAIMKVIESKPKDPNLRFAAYKAFYSLVPNSYDIPENFLKYLEDSADHVRIAVSKIINKVYSDEINNKMKEMIETGSRIAKVIVSAIIDSRSDNLFKFLLGSDAFTFVASDYLSRTTHPSNREFFLNILKSRGNNSMARSIERDAEDSSRSRKSVVVVDDSDIMHDYYISKLHASGFKPTVFKNPEDAFGFIFKDKPDLIITSFMLPVFSGIKLAEEIRKDLPSEDLPIVMVTGQNSFVKDSGDSDSVFKREIATKGVDRIFAKPLKMKELEVIRSLIS